MSGVLIGACCALGGLMLGYWIGYQIGRFHEYEEQWAQLRHPAGKGWTE